MPTDSIKVSPLSHALGYGTAVFEDIRCYDGPEGPSLFRVHDHVERFERTAADLGLRLPVAAGAIGQACRETVHANRLADAFVRPFAFLGVGSMGFEVSDEPVHLGVAAWPWAAYHGKGREEGIRAQIVPTVKVSGGYVNSVLAFREARRYGADEAILLNPEGCVAEGSGANVFLVRGHAIETPPAHACLPGIAGSTIQRLAEEAGFKVRETRIRPDDLRAADEVFLAGTAADVTPVRSLDERPIGDGRPGPVTRRLRSAYLAVARGTVAAHPEWRTALHERPLEVSAMNGGI